MRLVLRWIVLGWTALIGPGLNLASAAAAESRPPNIVLIYCDDLGYADVGCFGAQRVRTPRIDSLARDGVRFTDFYVAQPVCSASRAALLTGCYPNRIGIAGALDHSARHGLNPAETTIAEVLKTRGYATAIVGKWHLGHLPEFLPLRHGFDEWLGLPYSNDMWPFHPEAKAGTYPPLPLYDGDRVVEAQVTPAIQDTLTSRYTERAVQFIEAHARQPFFLYFAHSMPHVPLHVADARRGTSRAGLYGDVIEEIDASVGKVLDTLRRLRLERDTLVIFTSDNGPWLSYGDHAGSAGRLREGKGTVWEGGVRVPFVARWPGHIPRGRVCEEPAMTLDLLPTFARLAEAALPSHPIDGLDISALLVGKPGARTSHDAFWFYYQQNELQAIRVGRWKLILPHTYRSLDPAFPAHDGVPGKYRQVKTELALYDLQTDVEEQHDVAARFPETVAALQVQVEAARAELGDRLTGRVGRGVRPAGQASSPSTP